MAILKTTYVSGGLFVTGSENFVSASEFRGKLVGTASWAEQAVTASYALNISPAANIQVNSLHVSGNAEVDGNLKVKGDLEYIGTQDLRVKDHVIEINVDESGSAVASADGAGVIIKNTGAEGNIELIYSSSDDKLHVNKTIAGTIDSASEAAHAVSASRANSAASADKVANKLTFGAGISKSAATFDGSEAVEIAVDASFKPTSASHADTADNATNAANATSASYAVSASHATSADEANAATMVKHQLNLNFKAEDGTETSNSFDGTADVTYSVDLSGLESKTHASASVADLQAQINAISGDSGSGTIAERIQEAIEKLDADADANASGTAVSGGVFVLSGVAFNEADGKLTSGSATSVEVEKAGEAAKAKAELLGAASDATSSMTLYGVKNYVDAKTGDGVNALSQSVATDIANVMASQSAADTTLSQSIAAVASNALNLVESSSYIAVSEKAGNKQTISAKTANVASASATGTDGLAIASDVKSYVDSKVSDKNVSAEGDDWVAASAADNKVTITTNVKAIASATAQDDGLAAASDVKSHVSASVAALSSSVAAKDSAQDGKISALESWSSSAKTSIASLEGATASYALAANVAASESADRARLDALESATASYALAANVAASESADRARLDALETASGSAITRLNALETASATHVTNSTFNSYTASQANVDASQSARIATLETASSQIADTYVAKAGDTMSGALVMGTNGIQFGDMIARWNATEGCIEFVGAAE